MPDTQLATNSCCCCCCPCCRHEIVGIVTDVGSDVKKFQPGDRAGVGVFVQSCRECGMCKQGEDVFCPKLVYTYNAVQYDGTPARGGYSTHVVVDET
jgi:D-arabinose 1-dehydrogenase-like Zn-dependent alcohol dehydrogenase